MNVVKAIALFLQKESAVFQSAFYASNGSGSKPLRMLAGPSKKDCPSAQRAEKISTISYSGTRLQFIMAPLGQNPTWSGAYGTTTGAIVNYHGNGGAC